MGHCTTFFIYVPSTEQPGYASFNRYYFSQQDKLGTIIDERFNSRGSAVDCSIDVLQRDLAQGRHCRARCAA